MNGTAFIVWQTAAVLIDDCRQFDVKSKSFFVAFHSKQKPFEQSLNKFNSVADELLRVT